jgi:peptide-methionine (R)-S-oxide reductase
MACFPNDQDEETLSMPRRTFLLSGVALLATAAAGGFGLFRSRGAGAAESFPVSFTDEEWKKRLSPEAYSVLRHEATERPFTSALNENKRQGVYHCAGCDTAVYSSAAKYDSGTGWPSFWQPVSAEVIGTRTDYVLVYPRTEVHCAACGGHFGHIFEDGPPPTGQRHCLNGVALRFEAAPDAAAG